MPVCEFDKRVKDRKKICHLILISLSISVSVHLALNILFDGVGFNLGFVLLVFTTNRNAFLVYVNLMSNPNDSTQGRVI